MVKRDVSEQPEDRMEGYEVIEKISKPLTSSTEEIVSEKVAMKPHKKSKYEQKEIKNTLMGVVVGSIVIGMVGGLVGGFVAGVVTARGARKGAIAGFFAGLVFLAVYVFYVNVLGGPGPSESISTWVIIIVWVGGINFIGGGIGGWFSQLEQWHKFLKRLRSLV